MTDNEIIKALSACLHRGCNVCIRRPEEYGATERQCSRGLMKDALSLINRQKAEIEALRMDNQQLQSDIANANMNADHALAEIERLQSRNSELDAELDDLKRDDLPRCKDALRRANEIGMDVDKENQELREEIERLQKELKITRAYIHDNGLEWDLLSKNKKAKSKCDCYHTETKRRYTYNPITGQPIGHDIVVGVCWGTKECDECSCGGDEAQCDFYPKKRNGG